MTTAKEVITDMRKTFYPLIKKMDKKDDREGLTYAERIDHTTRVAWERALTFALAVMESEEDGTLDEKLKALTSKPKRKKYDE